MLGQGRSDLMMAEAFAFLNRMKSSKLIEFNNVLDLHACPEFLGMDGDKQQLIFSSVWNDKLNDRAKVLTLLKSLGENLPSEKALPFYAIVIKDLTSDEIKYLFFSSNDKELSMLQRFVVSCNFFIALTCCSYSIFYLMKFFMALSMMNFMGNRSQH